MFKYRLHRQQKGFVSILVTMFLMIILSLIVIGFAKTIRREQRQVLDRQLSTQAFYAAESGVNDVGSAIKKLSPSELVTLGANSNNYKNDCKQFITDYIPAPGNQLSGTDVEYTCLLVDPAPSTLSYPNVDTTDSTVIPIISSSAISSITLSWQSSTAGSNFGQCPAAGLNLKKPVWDTKACDAGVLRVDLVPTSNLIRANLASSVLTTFIYPQSGATGSFGTLDFTNAADHNGSTKTALCNSIRSNPSLNSCNFVISGLGGNQYYLRVRSVYEPNTLLVCANSNDCSSGINLAGAQAAVDATGKATDVLRRISARIDVSGSGNGVPSFAIQSKDSVCKRLAVTDTGASFDSSGVPGGISGTSAGGVCYP